MKNKITLKNWGELLDNLKLKGENNIGVSQWQRDKIKKLLAPLIGRLNKRINELDEKNAYLSTSIEIKERTIEILDQQLQLKHHYRILGEREKDFDEVLQIINITPTEKGTLIRVKLPPME